MPDNIKEAAAEFNGKEGREKLKRLCAGGVDGVILIQSYVDHCSVSAKSARDLAKCTKESHRRAMRACLRLGLWPGPAEHIYIIPREVGKKNGQKGTGTWVANAQIGYKGLIALIRRHKLAKKVESILVYDGEPFRLTRSQRGMRFHHETKIPRPSDEIVAVYAMATLPNGETQIELMTIQEVDEIARKHGNKDNWAANREQMVRKTPISRLANYLGTTDELARALALAHELDGSHAEPRNVTPRRTGAPAALLENAATWVEDEVGETAGQTVEV